MRIVRTAVVAVVAAAVIAAGTAIMALPTGGLIGLDIPRLDVVDGAGAPAHLRAGGEPLPSPAS